MKKSKQEILNRYISRRQFLIGTGSTFLTLPPLLSLMPREVAAQVASQKKVRSVIYIGLTGIDQHQMVPIADPAGLISHPGAYSTRYKTLSSFGGPISRMIDSSFVSMYPHMNLIKGLSLTGGLYQGHNLTVLSGSHSGVGGDPRIPLYGKSIDVIMEQSPNVYRPGEVIKQKALRIGGDPGGHFSFDRVSGQRISTNYALGDTAVFNLLLKGLTGSNPTPPTQQITNSKLIVDQFFTDLKTIEQSSRLSSEDRIVLDRFITSFSDVQKRVQATGTGASPTCTQPSLPLDATTSGNGYQFPWDPAWGVQNTSVVFDNYIEMIRLAFMCDLTRVVVIQNSIWSDSPISPASSGGLHHECPSSNTAADRHSWGLQKMLKLSQALQSTSDPQGGTLLDNSTVLYTNELGDWTTGHNVFSLPAVIFGRGGGLFKTGYYIDYTQIPKISGFQYDPNNTSPTKYYPGRPFKQLLQSIMQSMGVTKTEYMQFGDGNGFGEFKEGINQFGKINNSVYTPYKNEHNDLLPLIAS